MDFIINILKGIALGAGCILPGISSGVLCVMFGIYDKLVESILNLFKKFKENIIFLLPIFIGFSIGFFIFGNFLNILYIKYEKIVKTIFIILLFRCVPSFIKETHKNGKYFRLHYLIYTITAFVLSIAIIFLENNLNITSNINPNFLYLFISGFLMSIGVVFPGISSTVILMLLNIYSLYLKSISTFNIQILFPIGLGLIIGSLIFLKLVNYLIKKYRIQTMYSILGFIIGSTIILIPSKLALINIFIFMLFYYSINLHPIWHFNA